MIWYYLYMGLLILTLVVWAIVALKPARPRDPEPESKPQENSLEFPPRR